MKRPIADAPRTLGQLLELHPARGKPFLGYYCHSLGHWVEDRGRLRKVREDVTRYRLWDERAGCAIEG